MLLTHNSELGLSATAVTDVRNPLLAAQPPQLVAPVVSKSGVLLRQCCATQAEIYCSGLCLCGDKACPQAWVTLGRYADQRCLLVVCLKLLLAV